MENESDDARQPAEDECFGETIQSMEPDAATPIVRPFTAPKTDHVHDIFSDLIGPVIGSADGYELHFYDVNSYNYLEIKKTIPVKDPVHFPSSLGCRKAGRNAIHYRWQTGTQWGEWFDSEWFYFLRTPIITVSDRKVHKTDVPTITGVAEAGSHVQLARSGTHALLSNKFEVSAGGGFSFQTHKLTQGDYKAVVLNTQNGYHGVVLSAEHNFSVLLPPAIDSVDDGLHITPRPLIRGKGMVGATIDVYIKNTVTQVLKSVAVAADGTWAASSNHEFVASGSYTLVAYQTLRGVLSEEGPGHNFKFYVPPKILKPSPSTTQNASFLMEGHNGEPGAQLVVVEKSNPSITYGTTTVTAANGDWSIAVSGLPLRRIELVVKQFVGFSISISAVLPLEIGIPAPVIGSPPSGSTQDTSFRIAGTGALPGATVEIFEDLLNNPALGSKEDSAATWYVDLEELAPGPLSLVAMQTLNGTSSPRSGARNFKIRPAELTTVTVEQTDGATLVFSGNEHYNVKLQTEIQFTVPAAVSAPPNATVQPDGKWQTTATDWPFGEYDVEVIQKVSDNANGWIQSLPYKFKVVKRLPDVSDLKYTAGYQPTFSGKGFNGATVHVRHPNSANLAAPEVVVVGNEWSTTASAVWGPSNNREVHVKQNLTDQWSPTWCVLKVTIPPLAPGLNVPSEEGLSPVFSGTGWSGAEVHINFSGDPQTYEAPVAAEVWTFQRATPFIADTPHTIEVTQVAQGLESPKAAKTFTVYPVVEQPVITYPPEGGEVPRDLSVTGSGGMAGATMRLWDDRYGKYLTSPQPLINDGEWVIALTGLAFDEHVIQAEQTIYSRPFKRSEQRKFKAVVPPPQITCPNGGQKLPRTSKLTGKGMPYARVEVWMLGETSALLTEANVDGAGNWSAEVTLQVGNKTIWALQIYDDNGTPQKSGDSDPVTYQVVPKAPDIESPTTDEHAGRVLVVSGFGVAGDTVTVKVGTEQRSEPVRADRTWSVRLELGQPGGDSLLEVVSALDKFESEPAIRPIVLRTYLPTIEVPAPGSWVVNPVFLSGSGRQGVGEVVSWFDPDLVLDADIHVDPQDGWQAQAGLSLMTGGQWSRFRQSLDDVEKGSDWVVSKRYEVHPGSSKLL